MTSSRISCMRCIGIKPPPCLFKKRRDKGGAPAPVGRQSVFRLVECLHCDGPNGKNADERNYSEGCGTINTPDSQNMCFYMREVQGESEVSQRCGEQNAIPGRLGPHPEPSSKLQRKKLLIESDRGAIKKSLLFQRRHNSASIPRPGMWIRGILTSNAPDARSTCSTSVPTDVENGRSPDRFWSVTRVGISV